MKKLINDLRFFFARFRRGRKNTSVTVGHRNIQPLLIFRILFTLVFAVCSYTSLSAANKTFTGPGNFSDSSKWGGTRPVAGDNLRINGVCTIDNRTVTNNVQYGTIQIGRTSAGTIQWVSGGTNILNVTNVSSGFAGSSLNMTNGGTLVIRGTITTTNLAFTPGAGTIEIQSSLTLPTVYATYNNLVINKAGITVTTGVATTINSNLNVALGTFTAAAFALTVGDSAMVSGTFSISSATGAKTFGHLIINGTFNNSANVAITIDGSFANNGTYTGGTGRVTFTGATSNTISGSAATTAFNGGITVNKGSSNTNVLDVQSVITLSSGGLILTNGTFKLSSASTITPFTANIAASPYLIPATAGLWNNGGTVSASAIPWTIAGLLKVTGGTTFIGNALNHYLQPIAGANVTIGGGTLKVADRISNTGAAWTLAMTSGTLVVPYINNTTASRPPFNMDVAGCSFSVSGGVILIPLAGGSAGQNLGYYNMATSGSGFTGGTLQIGDATTTSGEIIGITSTNPVYNLSISSSNVTAIFQTSGLTVSNNVSITNGTLNLASLPLTVGGLISKGAGGTFAPGTAVVTLSGAEALNLGANGVTSFHSLSINTSGATLGANIAVTGTLNLTGGSLSLSTFNLTLGASATITGVGSNRYIKTNNSPTSGGYLIQPVSGTKVFPVGTSTYTPATVTNTGTADNFLVRVFDGMLTNGTSGGAHVYSNHAVNRTWLVEENTAGGSIVNLTLQWNAADENITFAHSACGVFHYTSNAWDEPVLFPPATVVSPGVYSMSRSGITSFSPFGIGDDVQPLPVEFLDFNASRKSNEVQLIWSTATEINNSYFAVERSADGNNFETIDSVAGAGNSNSIIAYEFTDKNPLKEKVSYYRLRQMDYDGATSYSIVKAVKPVQAAINIGSVYPVPATETVNINLDNLQNGSCKVEIYELTGRLLHSGMYKLSAGLQTLNLPTAELPQGTYLLSIRTEFESHSLKLVK